ncbi:DUF2199 domain-containing protein [Rhodoplanes roseus]|nr:DUF2199 domain-containing protein [Rhodoplanes roseus]
MLNYTWTCRCCGQPQEGLPLAWGSPTPGPYDALPDGERESRAVINADCCIIDDREFYIRGLIVLPIIGRPEDFQWIVWCSVSEDDYQRLGESWDDPDRARTAPVVTWLASALSSYEPGTLGLKAMLHVRDPGLAPLVELEPTDHPLAVEQREVSPSPT